MGNLRKKKLHLTWYEANQGSTNGNVILSINIHHAFLYKIAAETA